MKNTFLKHLTQFAKNTEITFDEMKDMVLDWYTPMKIYTFKLDGTRMIREFYTVAGPSGNARYDYGAKGYMVVFDANKLGFRTIVFRNVYRIDKSGKTYIVK